MIGVEGKASDSRDWPRALGLFAVAFGLSVGPTSVLVGLPLIALLLVFPTARMAGLSAGLLAALIAFSGAPREGLWYAERGWGILLGGWFAALTLRFPHMSWFGRAGLSVIGAGAVGATLMSARPGSWEVLDWLMADRMRAGVAAGIEAARLLGGGEQGLSPAVVSTVQQAAAFQAQVFPALLALASLASLGVAWWLYFRLGHGKGGVLAPVREFRFNDHLIWVFIAGGVLLLLGPDAAWERVASNVVVFMGALYTLRGFAVALFLGGGMSFVGAALMTLALLFVAPVVLAIALAVGLGDTWLDLRGRTRQLAAS